MIKSSLTQRSKLAGGHYCVIALLLFLQLGVFQVDAGHEEQKVAIVNRAISGILNHAIFRR